MGRFIPTHVGNSACLSGSDSFAAVHPHACGELKIHRFSSHPPRGSSPRMWGTRGILRMVQSGDRFIPTHVGNSNPLETCLPNRPVHPHACGELVAFSAASRSRTGSSPRMWGTLLGGDLHRCAVTVHPHACGELPTNKPGCVVSIGSSPRMWGTRVRVAGWAFYQRFIPTHVGNSVS